MLRGGLAVLLALAACSPGVPGDDAVPVAQACSTYSGGVPGTRTYLE